MSQKKEDEEKTFWEWYVPQPKEKNEEETSQKRCLAHTEEENEELLQKTTYASMEKEDEDYFPKKDPYPSWRREMKSDLTGPTIFEKKGKQISGEKSQTSMYARKFVLVIREFIHKPRGWNWRSSLQGHDMP